MEGRCGKIAHNVFEKLNEGGLSSPDIKTQHGATIRNTIWLFQRQMGGKIIESPGNISSTYGKSVSDHGGILTE